MHLRCLEVFVKCFVELIYLLLARSNTTTFYQVSSCGAKDGESGSPRISSRKEAVPVRSLLQQEVNFQRGDASGLGATTVHERLSHFMFVAFNNRARSVDVDHVIESIFSTTGDARLPQPVPLSQMIDLLVDFWEVM